MTICAGLDFNFLEQDLILLPQKAIYWKQQKALIAADVHLGKVGHFRKAGIAVPRNMEQSDLGTLSDLIFEHKPSQLIFLGDLFHSDMNADWEWFRMWRQQNSKLEIILIRGNHDIIHDDHYLELNVALYDQLQVGPFLMLHHPPTEAQLQQTEAYTFCGHIHPGVNLSGRARQSITIPCFAFGNKQAVLPSFGRFTGRVAIQRKKQDRVFGVLEDKVIAIG
jgi:DNA ligase-associated metallophosphoesterase